MKLRTRINKVCFNKQEHYNHLEIIPSKQHHDWEVRPLLDAVYNSSRIHRSMQPTSIMRIIQFHPIPFLYSVQIHVPQRIASTIAISILSVSRGWIFHLEEIVSDLSRSRGPAEQWQVWSTPNRGWWWLHHIQELMDFHEEITQDSEAAWRKRTRTGRVHALISWNKDCISRTANLHGWNMCRT
jgi:hypothetical protein